MPESVPTSPEAPVGPRVFELSNAETTVRISTEGGLIGQLQIAGVDIIVPHTPDNPKRSGIPRLGPVFGPVKGTDWESLYPALPQHGTARNTLMNVVSYAPTALQLEHSEGPARFMGAWQTRLEVQLLPNGIQIHEVIRNLESKPRERAVAYHPYFNNDARDLRFSDDDAGRLFSEPPPVGQPRILEGLSSLRYFYDGLQIALEFLPHPTKIVDWRASDLHRCIEPVWGDVGQGIIFEPEEAKEFSFRITAEPLEN